MKRKSVRFSVTDGNGHRAASWKVWVQKSQHGQEVYMSCRELGGYLHTSFHPSGEWHTVMTKKAVDGLNHDKRLPQKNRMVEEWPRPPEIKPGIILAYKIITPWASPTTPIVGSFSKVIQLPKAPKGQANETFVLISSKGLKLDVKNGSKIAEISTDGEDIVTIIDHHIEMPGMPQSQTGSVRYFQGKSIEDLDGEHIRILAFSSDKNGHRLIVDTRLVSQLKFNMQRL